AELEKERNDAREALRHIAECTAPGKHCVRAWARAALDGTLHPHDVKPQEQATVAPPAAQAGHHAAGCLIRRAPFVCTCAAIKPAATGVDASLPPCTCEHCGLSAPHSS